MKITIGGMPGSGKTKIGTLVAKKIGYPFYSMGDIRRELAQKRGLTISQFNNLKENTDKEVDDFQRELGKKKKDALFEGRLSFFFIPDSLKIYLDCDMRVAAERIFNADRATEEKSGTVDETLERLDERVDNDRKRYRKYYGVDCYDKKHFDYVIDTSRLSIAEVENKVLEIIKKNKR